MPTTELQELAARGIEHLIQLNEKNFVPYRAIALLSTIAAAQMAAGAILITTGIGAQFGLAVLTEGAAEIVKAAEVGLVTRNFTFKDYMQQKTISLTISAASLGWSGLRDVGKGLKSIGNAVLGETVEQAETYLTTQLIKQGGTEIGEVVTKSLANLGSLAGKQVVVAVGEATARTALIHASNALIDLGFEQFKPQISIKIQAMVSAKFSQSDPMGLTIRKMYALDQITGTCANAEKLQQIITRIISTRHGNLSQVWGAIANPIFAGILGDQQCLGSKFIIGLRICATVAGSAEIITIIDHTHTKLAQRLLCMEQEEPALTKPSSALVAAMREITTTDYSQLIKFTADAITDQIIGTIENQLIAPWSSCAISAAVNAGSAQLQQRFLVDPTYQLTAHERQQDQQLIRFTKGATNGVSDQIGHYELIAHDGSVVDIPSTDQNCGYAILQHLTDKPITQLRTEMATMVANRAQNFTHALEAEQWLASNYSDQANSLQYRGGSIGGALAETAAKVDSTFALEFVCGSVVVAALGTTGYKLTTKPAIHAIDSAIDSATQQRLLEYNTNAEQLKQQVIADALLTANTTRKISFTKIIAACIVSAEKSDWYTDPDMPHYEFSLNNEDIGRLFAAIFANPNIQKLDLSGIDLRGDPYEKLMRKLKLENYITALNLANTGISNSELKRLTKVLRKTPSSILTRLNLSHNRIFDGNQCVLCAQGLNTVEKQLNPDLEIDISENRVEKRFGHDAWQGYRAALWRHGFFVTPRKTHYPSVIMPGEEITLNRGYVCLARHGTGWHITLWIEGLTTEGEIRWRTELNTGEEHIVINVDPIDVDRFDSTNESRKIWEVETIKIQNLYMAALQSQEEQRKAKGDKKPLNYALLPHMHAGTTNCLTWAIRMLREAKIITQAQADEISINPKWAVPYGQATIYENNL
jgi:hypothetical protein